MSPREAAVRDVLARYKIAAVGLVPPPVPPPSPAPIKTLAPPLVNRSATSTVGMDVHRDLQKQLNDREPK